MQSFDVAVQTRLQSVDLSQDLFSDFIWQKTPNLPAQWDRTRFDSDGRSFELWLRYLERDREHDLQSICLPRPPVRAFATTGALLRETRPCAKENSKARMSKLETNPND
jgi:hypothetical protein